MVKVYKNYCVRLINNKKIQKKPGKLIQNFDHSRRKRGKRLKTIFCEIAKMETLAIFDKKKTRYKEKNKAG